MENLLIAIVVLLAILCCIAFGILSSVSGTQRSIVDLRAQLWNIRENQKEFTEIQFQSLVDFLERYKCELQESNLSLSDIKDIMNIIYKYKLPNKEEREFLDKVKIDNQLSDYLHKS
jgi:cell shape-determining protein MreC